MSDVSDAESFEDGEEEELDIPEDKANESLDEEGGEEEEVGEEEEKEPEPDPNPLTLDLLRDALSMLTPVGDGLSHAYTRIDLRSKELTDVAILQNYIHLRHVIMSNNAINDVSPLTSLTNLLTLKADRNRLPVISLESMPYLQSANFSHNKLRTMEGLDHPMLEKLQLSYNHIQRVSGLDPSKMLSLATLDLRANKLESTIGQYPRTLRELYMPANLIKNVEGLEDLVNLTVLHLRDNLIEQLDTFKPSLKSLQYVNLRGNQIQSLAEVKKLKELPKLRALALAVQLLYTRCPFEIQVSLQSENPLSEEDDYRLEVLVAMEIPSSMERLDKDPLEWEEMLEAKELLKQRKAEQEAAAAAAAAAQEEATETPPTSQEVEIHVTNEEPLPEEPAEPIGHHDVT